MKEKEKLAMTIYTIGVKSIDRTFNEDKIIQSCRCVISSPNFVMSVEWSKNNIISVINLERIIKNQNTEKEISAVFRSLYNDLVFDNIGKSLPRLPENKEIVFFINDEGDAESNPERQKDISNDYYYYTLRKYYAIKRKVSIDILKLQKDFQYYILQDLQNCMDTDSRVKFNSIIKELKDPIKCIDDHVLKLQQGIAYYILKDLQICNNINSKVEFNSMVKELEDSIKYIEDRPEKCEILDYSSFIEKHFKREK